MLMLKQVSYTDQDITFFVQVFEEGDYAVQQVSRIRAMYPKARIIVRSDGGSFVGADWSSVGVEFYAEERLFTAQSGGSSVHRMLELYAARPSTYLIKVDPDSAFHRRLAFFPAADGLFGSLQESGGCRSVQGGFLGMTRTAAMEILSSKLLDSHALRAPSPESAGYLGILGRRAKRIGLASFDWSLGWCASNLRIAMTDFSEVNCQWLEPPANPNAKFAVTHPDPDRPDRP